jgi:hypothetical protein
MRNKREEPKGSIAKELQEKTRGLDTRSKQFEADMMSIRRKIKTEQRSLMHLKLRRGDPKLTREMHLTLGKLGRPFLRVGFRQFKQSDERKQQRDLRLIRQMEQYRKGTLFKQWREDYLKRAAIEAAMTMHSVHRLNQFRAKTALQYWNRHCKSASSKLSRTLRAKVNDKAQLLTPKHSKGVKATSVMRVSPSWLQKIRRSPVDIKRIGSNLAVRTPTSRSHSLSAPPTKQLVLQGKTRTRLRS